MSESTLTLDFLLQTQNLAKRDQPFNKPIIGIIINTKLWRDIKAEMEKNFPILKDFSCFGLNDKFGGADVYEADIPAKNTEVWFDKEMFQNRLNQLKIK